MGIPEVGCATLASLEDSRRALEVGALAEEALVFVLEAEEPRFLDPLFPRKDESACLIDDDLLLLPSLSFCFVGVEPVGELKKDIVSSSKCR